MADTDGTCTSWLVSGPRPRPEQVGDMDEISQDPKLNVRFPRGRWLDAVLRVALIAAAVIVVMTARGSRPAASPAGRPGTAAAPAPLPSTPRARIPLAVRPARG